MNINIDYQSRTPIYEQIVKAIENMVAIGVLKPNEQISSIRELALSLSINPNTVKKAYDILENKNIIVSKSTKGTFITSDINKAKEEKISFLTNEIKETIKELEALGLTKDKIFEILKGAVRK